MVKNTNSHAFTKDDIENIENELAKILSYFRNNAKIPFICNTEFEIYCDNKDTFHCGIVRDVEYMYSYIRINISQYSNIENIYNDFCHEVAHIALIEFWSFFNIFIGYDGDEQVSYQIYKRTEENVACLLGDLLRNELKKELIHEC